MKLWFIISLIINRIVYYGVCVNEEPLFFRYSKKLRIKKGLSHQALADLMFVARSTVVRWEPGTRLPDAVMIAHPAEVLDVDVNLLLFAAAESDESPNVIPVDDRKLILQGVLMVLNTTGLFYKIKRYRKSNLSLFSYICFI